MMCIEKKYVRENITSVVDQYCIVFTFLNNHKICNLNVLHNSKQTYDKN